MLQFVVEVWRLILKAPFDLFTHLNYLKLAYLAHYTNDTTLGWPFDI